MAMTFHSGCWEGLCGRRFSITSSASRGTNTTHSPSKKDCKEEVPLHAVRLNLQVHQHPLNGHNLGLGPILLAPDKAANMEARILQQLGSAFPSVVSSRILHACMFMLFPWHACLCGA